MLGKPNRGAERFPDDRNPVQEFKTAKEEPKMVKDYNAPKDANTFIAKGSEFVGKLTFEGTVVIDGKADGEIFSKGTLIIGPSGDIKAKINVETVVLSGTVNGNIYAAKKIEMHAPAKLKGNIQTPSLVIEEGVLFEGNCKMDSSSAGFQAELPASRQEPKPEPAPAAKPEE